jgi:hypothetical protein
MSTDTTPQASEKIWLEGYERGYEDGVAHQLEREEAIWLENRTQAGATARAVASSGPYVPIEDTFQVVRPLMSDPTGLWPNPVIPGSAQVQK